MGKNQQKKAMQYTGDPNDMCSISFTKVKDIERPVGFDSAHAFECECIVEWLSKGRCINPITSQVLGPVRISSVLHPLKVTEIVNESEIQKTVEILEAAGNAIDSENTSKRYQLEDFWFAWRLSWNGWLWISAVFLLRFYQSLDDPISNNCYEAIQIALSMLAFSHLVFETLKRYPVNGPLILRNIIIGSFLFQICLMAFIRNACGIALWQVFVMLQGNIFTGRVIVDLFRNIGMHLP